MLKKAALLLVVLFQIGMFSARATEADGTPEPVCFPCAR